MIAGDTIHVFGGKLNTAEDISSTHHHAHLNACLGDLGNLGGEILHAVRINPKRLRPRHSLAAEF